MKIPLSRLLVLFFVAMLLALEVWLHLQSLPAVEQSRIWTIGGVAELIVWSLLAMLLVGTQIWELPTRIRYILNAGLTLWLIAATADLMDEVLVQPLWMSSWTEDLMRVSGMLIVTIALLGLLRHTSRVMRELERLSLVDPLTGLSNRRSFRVSILGRSSRGFSLILMDLDHFKTVNDRFGHDAGDEVLCKVAEALIELKPAHSEVFRLGGEEFALVAEPLAENELLRLAENIRAQIAVLNPLPALSLTLSAGVGTLHQTETHSQLMRRTDQALYRAKDLGRNQVQLAATEAAPAPI